MESKKKTPAISYIRVSTERQAAEGVSLSAQTERIKAWAKFNDHEVVSSFEDAGISGSKMKTRPGLLAALDAACKTKGTLVVYSLSRLARSTRDALEISDRLHKAGANLVSITENLDTTSAAGIMIFGILAVLCEFEKNVISERTRGALAYKKANNQKTGGTTPYGWDNNDGVLERNKIEQEYISVMADMRLDKFSFQKIADLLNRQGVKSKTHKLWSAKVVRGVLIEHGKRGAA